MEADKDKFWVQPKQDGNGFTSRYCLICKKHMTYEHIGYTAKSQHRTRRLDANHYVTPEEVEEWKREEAIRIKNEDEQQAEAKKKDEAKTAEEALARGDALDVGEDVPMVDNQKESQAMALAKALQSLQSHFPLGGVITM